MRKLVSCAALMIGLSGPVHAHPHIFIDAGAGFLFDAAGRLTPLRISWRYDEFATLFLFDTLNLGTDGDGTLNDADRAAIVAGETNGPQNTRAMCISTWQARSKS